MVRPLAGPNLALSGQVNPMGAAAFSPSDVANLTWWIDPDDATTVALDVAEITTVQDKVTGTSGTQLEHRGGSPAPDIATVVGREWMDFSGTDVLNVNDGTLAAVNMGTGSFTMWMVARPTYTTGTHVLMSKGFTGFYSFRSGPISGDLGLVFFFDDVAGSALTNTASASGAMTQNEQHLIRYTCDRSGDLISIHLDGVLQGSATDIAGYLTIDDTAQNLVVGARASGASHTQSWTGQLGEILIYKDLVSAGDITAIEAHLSAKWSTA